MKCDAEKREKNFQIMQRLQLANKMKKHTKKQVGCPVDREQKKKKEARCVADKTSLRLSVGVNEQTKRLSAKPR